MDFLNKKMGTDFKMFLETIQQMHFNIHSLMVSVVMMMK